ncbi:MULTISPECIES: hypothetical protein [unclassified Novosphingobium]|uniref:hypothetical protein n=1 Tax=unclassified Novosphingobium TaxID=2644732 RepID=UPI00146C4AA4|nr:MULTISPECIES: hypothetical protein [unclassified Novosphingobium]NMN06714.1 hypothetical protein [Novosphingobium sp. SG919]NMN88835.1 hypothetical protein [Novosphingobium sp. SG916]
MERAAISQANERATIKARVKHLSQQDQIAVERATRILRAYFVDRCSSTPKRGTLLGIMLAEPTTGIQRASVAPGDRSHLEFWVFVDHPRYKGLDKYWGRARAMLASELPMATTSLSVFTPDEMERARLDGNRHLIDKFDAGIMLYGADLAESDVPSDRTNDVVRSMLRMALALLDRNGLAGAACDVSSALEKLGEVFPSLSEAESADLLESWMATAADFNHQRNSY